MRDLTDKIRKEPERPTVTKLSGHETCQYCGQSNKEHIAELNKFIEEKKRV